MNFVQSGVSIETVDIMIQLAEVVEENMDGTSGAIFGIYMNGLATALGAVHGGSDSPLGVAGWADAASQALDVLFKATPARVGDRTLIDSLEPFVRTLKSTNDLKAAAAAGKAGCEHTQGMKASLGRAVYVAESGYDLVPDPGAMGISEIVTGLAE